MRLSQTMSDPREGANHWTKRDPWKLWWRGENHPNSKLKAEQVREIRRRFYDTNESRRSIARAFGICPRTAREILEYRSWRHVR